MKLTEHVLVAGRYQLVNCLGAGAMGEVWRAQDTRFETRNVAVKFLREDETLKEDQLNRDRLTIRLEQHAARGTLSFETALGSVVSALGSANPEGVRTKLTSAIGQVSAITPAAVVAVFDELVNDPTLNDNARMRAKLRRLFRDEANAVANLRHDNIVSIFDYGDHEGSPYLVMDYIEGRTLYQVIQERKKLANSRRLLLIEDLCAGLGYAHRHKLVHRDIKPANLIIDGSTGSLKILDFGVVRRLGSASTVGVPVGTFCYMSPEQTKGAATLDHRSDIFAVGLVFYELMVGKKAYPPGKSIGDLVARIQRDPPPDLLKLDPSIPTPVQDIIEKAIQKLPENRYPDLSIMERDIRKLRMRLQAEEQQEGTSLTVSDDQTILKPRPLSPSPTQLLASAQSAFDGGDDKAAGDLARQLLALTPDDTAAIALLDRINARTSEARVLQMLQPAEKFLAGDELTSARGALANAESVNPSSPALAAFKARLDAAERNRVARLDRVQRERERHEQEQQAQQERAREQERLEREQRLQEERTREQARLERERRAREERANEQARLAAEQRAREEQERRAQEQRAREEQERVAREQKAQEERERQEREQREREEKAREQERLAREQKAREERERQEREQREREEKAREQERLAREQKAREERERQERELSEQRERARQERERQEGEQRARAQQEREQRERVEAEQRQQDLRQQRLREAARADLPGDVPTDVTVQLSQEALRAPLSTPPALSKPRHPSAPPVSRKPNAIPGQPPAAAPEPPAPLPPPVSLPSTGPRTARPSGKSKRYTAKPAPPKPGPADSPAPAPSASPSSGSRPVAAAVTVPPLATARPGVSPSTLGIAAAVILLVLVAIAVLVWVRSGASEQPVQPVPQVQQEAKPDSEPPPPPSPSPTPSVEPSSPPAVVESAPIEAPAPAMMSTVYIDLRPWARVRIVPGTPDPAIPTETFYAPFAVDLPPGDYNLEAENGGVTRAASFQLKVVLGGPQTFVRNMPGFNATKVVEGLLGQD